MDHLVDINVLLRSVQHRSPWYRQARNAVQAISGNSGVAPSGCYYGETSPKFPLFLAATGYPLDSADHNL